MNGSAEFYLPLGLVLDGKICRKGHMHLATTRDELELQAEDDVGINTRYRDVLLLAKVIDDLEGVPAITTRVIEELFEADFLYLQLLYKDINGEAEAGTTSKCPYCGETGGINLSSLYKDMGKYKESE